MCTVSSLRNGFASRQLASFMHRQQLSRHDLDDVVRLIERVRLTGAVRLLQSSFKASR